MSKKHPIVLSLLLLPMLASASTIVLSGGMQGVRFYASPSGADNDTDWQRLDDVNATIEVGAFMNGVFEQFAPKDVGTVHSPHIVGDVLPLLGAWGGSASDNSSTANSFNGLPIWYRITITGIAGVEGVAYLTYSSENSRFPINKGGVGDEYHENSVNLDTVEPELSTLLVRFQPPSSPGGTDAAIVFSPIPEPGAAIMGALGLFGLLGRRRRR